MITDNQSKIIRLAIKNAGGATVVADCFGIERTSVYKWIYKSSVPPEHVKKLSELSGISCYTISPNIFPKENPSCANN